ncbi:amidohydrolase family protein [Brucellaceae bacterium C25G]
MSNLLIRNVRPMAGENCDILIENGRIRRIESNINVSDIPVEDAGGAIAIPGMAETHTHLDKTMWDMPWYTGRKGGVLQDLVDNERNSRIPLGIDVHRQSMRHAIRLISTGTTHIRSHVDIDTEHGLSLFEGLVRTRDALAGIVDIQIVAFPQSGLMVRPGTAELLDEALSAGADIVGGLDPSSFDRDPKASLDKIFALAVKHGKPIDIHLHEAGELGAFTTEMIMDRTEAEGLQGKVGISHAFCLGMPDQARVAGLIERLAGLDMRIFTTGAPSATCPSIMALRAAGVKVGIGCDGIRDTWGPWGQADMMDRARIVGMKNKLRRDEELVALLDIATTGGAAAIDVSNHTLTVGAIADLTLVAGETLAHAVVETAPRPLVVKAGRVVARGGQFCVAGVSMP